MLLIEHPLSRKWNSFNSKWHFHKDQLIIVTYLWSPADELPALMHTPSRANHQLPACSYFTSCSHVSTVYILWVQNVDWFPRLSIHRCPWNSFKIIISSSP